MNKAVTCEWWQHLERDANAVVSVRDADDVELSCASRAAFLPFLLLGSFLCSCIGPLMILFLSVFQVIW